ncbi:LysR family transcriptional regulator [Bradyrhizobium sp. LTSPM299]|uniref:LysR family transcriptional regulator n=1 Tax=Bradyrhizobium sp. LTSPM299 TaxID=1619233 RepID=UPI0005C9E76D|nr:LysR family transcriptional regulator [Bradyrhizobium sp. LTSPM299]KJC60344.1 LysR family transcriptional regulator [Bradyrhizobium sp. LTSPM299]
MEINYPKDNRRKSRPPAIDLQCLRFAVAASDCGSIRKAANTLSVRHSVLSRSIGQLEHLIGVALFERSSGGIKPTLVGQGVLRTARLVVEQVDALLEASRHGGRGETGRVSIGFYTSISAGSLRATLVEFRKRFPQIELATVERSRVRLVSAVRNGTVDVVISPDRIRSTDCKILSLWSERILLSLPENHALTARETVYWTDLRSETVLLSQYDPGRELEDLLLSKLLSSEDRPRIERHDVSRGIIKSLVSMGLGVSLVMESDSGAGLAYRELRDGTGCSRMDFSAHWRADNENPALSNLLKLLAERYPPAAARD